MEEIDEGSKLIELLCIWGERNGFELVAFSFEKIIPLSLTQFEVSYAQTAAEFNTFSMILRYNRFNIKRRIDDDNYSRSNS